MTNTSISHPPERGAPPGHQAKGFLAVLRAAFPAARRWGVSLAALGLALLAAGCREGGPGSKTYVLQGAGQKVRLAVLPFASPPTAPGAGSAVTSAVLTYLLSTGAFEVLEPGVVERAMAAARYVPETAEGLDPETLGILQQQLHADAFVVGRVEEYGEVRVGPDSYPAISFSARMVRAADATILWAASISRTGADRVRIFDIGRVSSIGKLTKSAVAEMAGSLRESAPTLIAALAPPPAGRTTLGGATAPVMGPAPDRPVTGAKFQDESRSYGIADMKAMLPEVPGATRGEMTHSKHFHDTLLAAYAVEGATIEVKLVDYLKAEIGEKFVRQASDGFQETKVEAVPSRSGTSPPQTPGNLHLNVMMGRFGLYLTGPQTKSDQIRQIAGAIVKANL